MQKLRNIAIIAHVDHGKTTLVDKMILAGNILRDNAKQSGELILDNNDLERERGITILSKNVSVIYKDYKITGTWEIIDMTARYARDMGLKPYYLYRQKNMAGNFENVGYASPGKACIYNILIMEEQQTIIGCGAGTTTKRVIPGENRIERCENVKNVEQYIERIHEMTERKQRLLED